MACMGLWSTTGSDPRALGLDRNRCPPHLKRAEGGGGGGGGGGGSQLQILGDAGPVL